MKILFSGSLSMIAHLSLSLAQLSPRFLLRNGVNKSFCLEHFFCCCCCYCCCYCCYCCYYCKIFDFQLAVEKIKHQMALGESKSNCTQSKEHSRIFQKKLLIQYVLYSTYCTSIPKPVRLYSAHTV